MIELPGTGSMRNYPFTIVIITLLLTPVFPVPGVVGAQPCGPDDANTLVVGGSQPEEYASIQAAIDDACEGDSIKIQPGVYHERIVVNKTLFIYGLMQKNTIINGSYHGDVITVTADNCTLSRLMVVAGGYNAGIKVRGNNTTVEYCIVNTSLVGIYITESWGNLVHNCTISFCGHGMQIATSYDNVIADCIINRNQGDEINFWLGYSNTIMRVDCLDNTGSGFYLYWLSMDNSFLWCNALRNEHGFYVFDCDRTTITRCNAAYNSKTGIHLESIDNFVTGCDVWENGKYGFYCYHAIGNLVEDCTVWDTAGDGIYLKYSEGNNFTGNVIKHNDGCAVKMGPRNSGNAVYGNDFLCNNDWKVQAEDIGDDNRWDDGESGNFWSDHTYRFPNATSGGGHFDVPYTISGSNTAQDSHPLTAPAIESNYPCPPAPPIPPDGTSDGDDTGDGGEGPGHDDGGEGGDGDDGDPYDAADGTMVMSLVLLAVLVIFVAYMYGCSRRRG
jgi:parallel beta-helix repeat protein